MIKELLDKRVNDYLQTTKDILYRYEENLIRAIRFFTKTDKDIQITSLYLYPTNPNFIVNVCKVYVTIGDKIKNHDGEIITVDESNINTVPTNDMSIILPIKVLEDGNAIQMYDQLVYMENFVKNQGRERFERVLQSGIASFDDLLDENNEELLEQLTDPVDIILKSLDEIQVVQYNLFLKENDRTLH